MDLIIRNATIVNEGKKFKGNVGIKDGLICYVSTEDPGQKAKEEIDAEGLLLIPGLIDDQVHFREPGLTHKGEIYTESKAAVAGGTTSFMEQPNTVPNAVTVELLDEKYAIAANRSFANYSFFMGTTNSNLEELMKLDRKKVCGVKMFLGSSTGNMLVDDPQAVENVFKNVKLIIAAHCEDDPMIKANQARYTEKYGEDMPARYHGEIRSAEACYKSSSFAISLARKHGARFHVFHVSTARELELFDRHLPLKEKKITAEACLHHLWFSDADYDRLGNFIKWNPAVKTAADRDAILQGVLNNAIDVLATDHAPHTLEEKQKSYLQAPSGGPLVQHNLQGLLEFYHQGKLSLETIVQKAAHNVADLFDIDRRGYIREGYHADLVLVDLNKPYTVTKDNILYKCGWSPFEGYTFKSSISKTFVNGELAFDGEKVLENVRGKRLLFNRQ